MTDKKTPTITVKAKPAPAATPEASIKAKAVNGEVRENLLTIAGKNLRDYSKTQLDFAEENATAYFQVIRDVVGAKSLTDATTAYGQFVRNFGPRRLAQAQSLGRMALENTRELGGEAVSRIRERVSSR